MKWPNRGDALSSFARAPVAITTTANAMPGRWNECSGTSADYTVTLPPAASWAGQMLGLRMKPLASLSKRVTVDGNGSEKIDDALTRMMWAGETALLLSDGSNVFKVGGRTIPMVATATLTGVLLSAGANVKQTIASALVDNTGAMVDAATNERVNILRDGNYLIGAKYSFSSISGYSGMWYCYIYKNGSLAYDGAGMAPGVASQAPSNVVNPVPVPLVAGDYLEVYGRTFTGTPTPNTGQLYALEVPGW